MVRKAAIYARYSSDNQREESIEAQVRAIEEYAKNNDIKIVKRYFDRAKSATTDKRPGFQQMISDSSIEIFDIVIVHKLDRFSRDKYDSAKYKRILKQNGVKLISVTEHLDGSPESGILETLIEGMAEYYSKNLAREVMKGMKETALQCKHTGGVPPLGYDLNDDKTYKINEREAEAVKVIYEMYSNGHGYADIARELNNMGIRTKTGRTFSKNSLGSILRNEKYTGVYIFNKNDSKDAFGKRNTNRSKSDDEIIRVPGGVPEIISKELFDNVQNAINRRQKAPGANKAKVNYLLSGLIKCGECGYAMNGNRRTSNIKPVYMSYRCGCRQHKYGCSNKEIRKEYIEEFVLSELEKHIMNDEAIPLIVQKVNDYIGEKINNESNKVDMLKSELKKVEDQMNNAINAIINGFAEDILKTKLNELESRKFEIETEIIEIEAAQDNVEQIDEKQIKEIFSNIKHYVQTRNIPECKKFISDYVKEVIVYEDHVEVTFNMVFSFSGKNTSFEKKIELTRKQIYKGLVNVA
jgi:site-specific DNA recombinase